VLTIVADRRLDVRSTMTVRDPAGTVVGVLRKRGAASLLRSTWEAEQPGRPVVVVQERSLGIALLRRAWNLVPWVGEVPLPFVFHFDGVDPAGRTVLTHERRWGLRDRYVLEVRPDASTRAWPSRWPCASTPCSRAEREAAGARPAAGCRLRDGRPIPG
jgi:hypothetical protein